MIVAQLVTGALVAVLPPPRPPIYRLGEIAEALRGGPLVASYGRRFERHSSPAPPSPSSPAPPPEGARVGDRDRVALAALLGMPPADVRYQLLGLARSSRWMIAALSPWRPPRWPRSQSGAGKGGHPHGRPWGAWAPDASGPGPGDGDPDRLVLGDFVAAVRRAGGDWVVVRPTPEAFPNDWERRILLWFGLSLMLVLPAGYVFARRITAPLRAFARAAERFGRDPNAPLLALSGPAEIGVAARAFNDMQARLKRYVQDRTAMVGAISHDLRTPLARIRFRMERASPELRGAVIADVEQMEAMIAAVLAFIRDASAQKTREPLDLLSVLECAVDDATTTGGAASILTEAHPTVEGDAVALQRLFANLIDNAIRYGARAEVSIRQGAGCARVEIADEGPGLPPAELERVFEPFYRAERSRNLDAGGIGLGLAIARSIAREHGGDLDLVNGPRGLIARVQLPADDGGGPAGRTPVALP